MMEIYKHTSPTLKYYIGYSKKGMEMRWKEHVASATKNSITHFSNAIRKYGPDNFRHEILAEAETKIEALDIERFYIAWFQSNNNHYGYNMTKGGVGGDTMSGRNHSEETKQKMRENNGMKGKTLLDFMSQEKYEEWRQKIKEAGFKRRGKPRAPHTEETKKRMSEDRKGNPKYALFHSEETKHKIGKANKGKKRSPEMKSALSKHMKTLPYVECSWCGKVGRQGVGMYRWHFDNCKRRKNKNIV